MRSQVSKGRPHISFKTLVQVKENVFVQLGLVSVVCGRFKLVPGSSTSYHSRHKCITWDVTREKYQLNANDSWPADEELARAQMATLKSFYQPAHNQIKVNFSKCSDEQM